MASSTQSSTSGQGPGHGPGRGPRNAPTVRRTTRRRARAAALALAAITTVLVSAGLAAPAGAEPPDLTVQSWPGAGAAPATGGPDGVDDTERVGTGRTCVLVADPLPAGADPLDAPAPVETCFDSLAEALEAGTGTPVVDPLVVAGDRAALRAFAEAHNAEVDAARAVAQGSGDAGVAAVASRSVILGFIAKGQNWTGTTTTLWGSSGSGCVNGVTYGFPNMRNVGFNNVIRSADSYNKCWGTYYDDFNYAGARRNCTPTCTTMGSMDKKTSSIIYRPVGTFG